MREKDVEQALVQAVKKIGGMCPKFVSPGTNGMPDRIALLPGGRMGFIEVKAPKKKPRPRQVRQHQRLKALGFPVFVLDDPEKIEEILAEIRRAE